MKRVLIIDDDEAILEATRFAVELAGFEVKTVVDPENIVEIIKEFKPSLVLLDLLLAGKDGKEVLKEIRGSVYTKDIPVIMLSAHPSAKENAKDAGANDFIPKPYDIDELVKRIKKHIK